MFPGVGAKIREEEEDKLRKKLPCDFPKLKNKGMLDGLCCFVVGKSGW